MSIRPYSTLIVAAVFLLVILEILIDMGIKMPWHDWLDANIPPWAAIMNFICLNIFGIIIITKIKDKFTEKLFNMLFIFFLISWFLVLVTSEKIPNSVLIVSIAVLALTIIKWGSRRSEIQKVFMKWESSSNDDK
jgi:hypothetical protein